ncbi:MAG: acetolactate synthase large subunit [Rhodobacteraceae bacterium]|jgi:acetolactate synthase-1/2/3 large subunit|nr:acetolactate synthase large subunit [Paracoccaceae bacterium]
MSANPVRNGAQALCDGLIGQGVTVCFANPGTSEMHFVGALDSRPQMRCVLGLAEGVVTGAADGYARMADRPAVTLLHLGPGLANGLSNLHNARRAGSPVINVVGDHAVDHLALDPPLASDIDSLARPMSDWVHRCVPGEDLQDAAAEAWLAATRHSGVATMILPADLAWSPATDGLRAPLATPSLAPVETAALRRAAAALQAPGRCLLLLGGHALRRAPARIAASIAARTGADILAETFNSRIERGGDAAPIAKLPYPIRLSLETLARYDRIVLIGADAPVAFFAYPDKPAILTPDGCEIVTLATRRQDVVRALEALADAVGTAVPPAFAAAETALPPGNAALTADIVSTIVATALPEGAIVVDESVTSGRAFFPVSQHGPAHDYLQLTGGAIGIGLPLATGAAIAAPGRRVIGLQADGSAMYSLQALWTQAREGLDVTTVIYANRRYAILQQEMINVGLPDYGPAAARMFEIDNPGLDWVALARGHGVEAARAETAAQFADLLRASLTRRGPFVIEAVI